MRHRNNIAAAMVLAVQAVGTGIGLAQTPYADQQLEGVAFRFWSIVISIAVVYLIPAFVAFVRAHPNRWPILLINVVFGGTGLGWFGALIWAASAIHRSPTGNHGGESGLNIFANDPHPVHITNLQPQLGLNTRTPSADISDIGMKLLRLKELRQQGALDADEYSQLREALIKQLA